MPGPKTGSSEAGKSDTARSASRNAASLFPSPASVKARLAAKNGLSRLLLPKLFKTCFGCEIRLLRSFLVSAQRQGIAEKHLRIWNLCR